MLKSKKVTLVIGAGVLLVILLTGFQIAHRTTVKENATLTKVRVQAGWLLNAEFANVCSAIVNGYYRESGLDVELVPGGPQGASFIVATNAVALDESLTVGIDGDVVPLLRSQAKEDPNERMKVRIIGAFWNKNPYGFMVTEASGITSIRDFAKTRPDGEKYRIGITADAVIQNAIAEYTNVPVESLNLVTVGFDASPLLAGQVDALAGYWTTQAYELEKAGVAYKFLPAHELPGFDQPSMVVVAREQTIQERRKDLETWMRATIRGTEFVVNNPEIAAEHILDPRCGGPTFDKAQEQWLIEKSLPLYDTDRPGWVYQEQVLGFSDAYKSLGQISRTPNVEELIDYSILDAIY